MTTSFESVRLIFEELKPKILEIIHHLHSITEVDESNTMAYQKALNKKK